MKISDQLIDIISQKSAPIVVVDGTVFVATMGATVAAATGVTGLKMGFCGTQNKKTFFSPHFHLCIEWLWNV